MSTVVTQLIVDSSGAEQGSQRYTAAMQRNAAAADQTTNAHARLQARIESSASAYDANARAAAAWQAQADRVAQAQARSADAYAASARASNDNTAALQKQSSAYAEVGKAALQHPILVLAGAAMAARALAGLATSAAGSLGTASVATAEYAATSTAMGGTVAAGALAASRGLGVASGAAAGAAPILAGLAEKASDLASKSSLTYLALRLIGQGLGALGPLLPAISVGFAAFEVGRAYINKAYADLDRLIQLGQKAQALDVSAPFLKGFESLGTKIGATTEQMDQALAKASSFLKDTWGQDNNNLSKLLNSITATGAAGAGGLQSTALADTATTFEERLKAGLAAMKELDALGLHLASIDVGTKMFGPETVERMRISNTSAEQLSAALQEAAEKEVLKQEQVDRALALNKNIADTKQGISDALAVNLDFSEAAIRLNETWLSILQAVKSIVDWINQAAKATTDFISSVGASFQGVFSSFGNLPIWKQINEAMDKMGLMDKDWQKAGQADPEALQLKVKPPPTITGRDLGYISTVVDGRKFDTGAAKQAQQAAQEAISAYDSLIQRTKDRIEELDLETKSVGLNTDAVIKLKLAHDLERAAQKSGIEVTGDMRAEWDRLGTSLAASTDGLAKAKRGLELTREAQRELGDDFSTFADDVVLGGKRMGEAFADLSKTLASSSLKALLTGQGGLAGLFGTAGEKSGDLGGLLGGKLNLGSLFGGSNAAGSPLPGAQGPSLPTGLFDTDKIADALGLGAETGLGRSITSFLKEQKPGGGFFSSQLGQGLAAVGAGASIGYSSQSPLMGALGGGLAGLASGNPLLAVAGAGAGAIGSIPSSKKDRRHVARQRLRDLA